MEIIISSVIALVLGGAIAWYLRGKKMQQDQKDADAITEKIKVDAQKHADKIRHDAKSECDRLRNEAKKLMSDAQVAKNEAEVIKRDKILQAKEAIMQMRTDQEKELADKKAEVIDLESKYKSKEQSLNQRKEELMKKQKEIETARKELDTFKEKLTITQAQYEKKEQELDVQVKEQIVKLEAIAGLSRDDAKAQLIDTMKSEAKTEAMQYVNDIMAEAKLHATHEAKRIVVQTIQRIAAETAIENSATVFTLENEEVKGRIIGREGRNIRALEAATGVEIIVDDTPDAILLSAFDPIRREVARLSLHQLVTDGRIHPARIEEVVLKMQKHIEEEIIETGKRTTIELGVHGLHPDLIRIIGKMKYRSSYGQNLLQHSREVAKLCATMASELGLNPKLAKRAGLLHDIGKVPDDQPEMPHALLGMQMAEKYKEKPEICNAIGAHHDEIEMTSIYSPIVQVCDAISGSRPGARREVAESYIKRLNELENLALSFDGVQKAYAIQAGRELRVIVTSEKITDKQAEEMSYAISKRIEKDMTYPGQIKVTVIRETRAVNYAK